MSKRTFASGSPFAHLLGRRKTTSAAKAEDMDDDDEESKKSKKGKRAEDGGDLDDPDENEDEKKDKLDEVVDDATDDDGLADDDDDDSDRDRAKKAKKAKKAEADDDKKDDEDAKAATRRERARCEAIFSSVHATGRPNVAARLAFKTDMSAKDAIGIMAAMDDESDTKEATPASAARNLRTRMSSQPNPEIGSDAERKKATGPSAFAESVIRAGKIRRGEI